VVEEDPGTIERLVGFWTVMFLVAVAFCPFCVYVTLTGTSPTAPLSAGKSEPPFSFPLPEETSLHAGLTPRGRLPSIIKG